MSPPPAARVSAMRTTVRVLPLVAVSVTLFGCGGGQLAPVPTPAPVPSQPAEPCQIPTYTAKKDTALDGTLIVQDKSKGVSWLFDFTSQASWRVMLPYISGNHESVVSPDGSTLAVPHYETVTKKGQGEGGSDLQGWSVSLVDIVSGTATTIDGVANPLGSPKPHDAVYLPDNSLLVTGQTENGMTRWMANGSATSIKFDKAMCDTPHLVQRIPDSDLAVSGCRCTNADCTRGSGSLVVFDVDLTKDSYKHFDLGQHAEGLTVTAAGDVWIGSMTSNRVDVFSFQGNAKTITNLVNVTEITVPRPFRLAYDPVGDIVAVASLNLAGVENGDATQAQVMLHTYDAKTHALVKEKVLTTSRGDVHMQGLHGFATNGAGYFVTGGFDTQAMVVVEASTLDTVVEILFPGCPSSQFCDQGEAVPWATARADEETGSNNWSGGKCPATVRNPLDLRWMVMDGFQYTSVRGAWAQAGAQAEAQAHNEFV